MFTSTMKIAVFALIFSIAGTAAQAQDWAQEMFDEREHDFGTVAKSAAVEHKFKVTNKYKEDVHISNVGTSCGCFSAKVENSLLKSLESTYIVVTVDTNRHQAQKTATMTVTFDAPLYATVTIPIKAYIRTDVVMTPGEVNFGAIDQGAGPDRKIEIAYAGRPDWRIRNVVTNNDHLKAKVVETRRASGLVNYDLHVALSPDAPVGKFRQQIILETDDLNSPQVPVLVQGNVTADITINPSIVSLGTVTPGIPKRYTVVLTGRKPFAIAGLECESSDQAFKMPEMKPEAKAVHILSLEFTPPTKEGPYSEKFIVTIAGRKESLTFGAKGNIIPTQSTATTQ